MGGNLKINGARTIGNTNTSVATVQVSGAKIVSPTAPTDTLLFDTKVNVSLGAGLDFGANVSTINAALVIQANGSVNTHAPIYANGSGLFYFSGGTYGRSAEWTSDTSATFPAAGYPHNVGIGNGTTLNMGANGGTATSFVANGQLSVANLSTFSLAVTPMTAPVTFKGGIALTGGTITLSTSTGGDLKTQGDFAISSGTFNANNRAVFFEGGAAQQNISNLTGPTTLPYVVINKSAGTVRLSNTDLTALAPTGGNSLAFQTAASTLTLNGRTLTLGGTLASVPGSGLVGGTNGDTLILNDGGTPGDMGTLPFASSPTLTNLTVNRSTATGNVTLGSTVTVGGALTLTSGTITTGANTLTIGGAGAATRTNGYIVGTEQKTFTANGSFTFDVGTANGYSPVEANSTTGAGSLSVKPTQTKQPNITGPNALARYWTLTGSGLTTDLTFHYNAPDVVGTESNYEVIKYNGSFSTPPNQTVNTTAHTATVTGVNSFSDWTLAEAASVFGQLQFSATNYNDTEGNTGTHTVTVNVQRTGASSGAVSVHYATSDGTATTAGSDYDATSGDLNWADGDSADKPFNVTVHGDTTVEPNETINLTLSAPTGGATLGTPATATITIQNDDTRPPASVVYVDDDFNGPVGSDPDGPATEIGYDAFPTIQGGVDGVAAGGTVNVAAGTYAEQPVVGKSLTLHGAGAGATNITAPATLATRFNNFFILFEVNGGASVEASGLTVQGPMNLNGCHQAIPASTFRRYYGIYVRGGATLNLHDASVLDIRENNPAANTNCQLGTAIDAGTTVAGLNQTGTLTLTNTTVTGFQARGVIVDNAGSAATITNNTLTGSTSANVSQSVILVALGASATISGNQIGGAECSDAVNCGPDTFTQAAAVGISLTTPASGTQVTNNTISHNDYGINIFTAPNVTPVISGNALDANRYFGVNVSEGNATITGNTFTGASNVAVVAASVNDPANQTAADSAITLTGNTITGATTALQLLDDPNNPADNFFPRITAHFNRIVAATAIDNPQSVGSDMENNWWGCNAGPGHTGCGTVTGTGVDYAPWLVLGISAAPDTITPGGTSTATADLTHNSDGVAPSNTTFLPPTPISFGATNGTVTPPTATTANGVATTTFTSTSAASGSVSATADNQTVNTNVTVTPPSFAINSVTHPEGDTGTTEFVFMVTKTGSTALSSSVNFTTVEGTASVNDNDYQGTSGTLNFSSTDTQMQITVLVNGDPTAEPDESFTVHLSNAVGATITSADGTGTITNDDGAQSTGTFQFSAANYTVNESRTSATITVTRTGTTTGAASLAYATSDGTATAGSDYTATAGTLNFASGEASKTFTVAISNDTEAEPNETVQLTLSNPSAGATLGTQSTATLTIIDNDGAATSNIIVVLPTNLQGWDSFNQATATGAFGNGPGTPPYGSGSYQMTTGAGTGAAGQGGKHWFKTNAYNGTRLDAISQISYRTYVDPTSAATDNLAPVLEMYLDVDSNGTRDTTLVFEPVYTPEQGSVAKGTWQTWNARTGRWRSTRTVGSIVPDTYFTLDTFINAFPDTTIVQWFPRADGYGFGASVGQDTGGGWAGFVGAVDGIEFGTNNAATINDFELAPPAISIDDVAQAEGDTGPTAFTFNVTLSGQSSVPVSVDYTTQDGTATVADGDYQAASGTLTFAPGETSKPITVSVNGDLLFETDETFSVQLANATGGGGATIADADGAGTIQNDDGAPTFTIDNVTHAEGDAGPTSFVFTVTRSGATGLSADVGYTTQDETASAGSDYEAQTGTLTFAPNEMSKQITVTVNGDTTYEADETFRVVLSSPVFGGSAQALQGVGTIQNDDAPPATLVVNTTNDIDDGFCLADHCSLREAINAANASSDANTINFQIPAATDTGCNSTGVCRITPATNLPLITAAVIIDGYTQAGASANTLASGNDAVLKIELDGSQIAVNARGLDIGGGGTSVRGLVINNFAQAGIWLQSAGSNTIAGNFLGTNADGTAAGQTDNSGVGIVIANQPNNTIGGAAAADRNVIAAFGTGVDISGAQATANSLFNNYIGTNAAGTARLDNLNYGVNVQGGAHANTIGCETADERNIISGNGNAGIQIDGSTSNNNVVTGNYIGVGADGTTAISNGARGIFLNDSGGNQIGGAGATDGNLIAGNGGAGIFVQGGAANSLRGNSIHDNAGLGIDLAPVGVTANDAQDADTGANNLQNFPVLNAATVTGSTNSINGTLNSTPGATFIIDFYANTACSSAGNGEGQTYLGSLTTDMTDAQGDVSFAFHPTALTTGQIITATATDAAGSTSEFSTCTTVGGGSAGTIEFTASTYTVGEASGTAQITVTRTGGSDGSISATFSTSDGTATAGEDYTAVSNQTVTYADGETGQKTVNVSIGNDAVYEGDETVNLSLSTTTVNRPQRDGGPKITISQPSAVLTITDDETAPAISINDVFAAEPASGTTNATFTVTLSGAAQDNVSVHYQTADGTATAPADYDAIGDTILTFTPGQTTKTVSVTVKSDGLSENTETFFVNLSNASSNATIADGQGRGTITEAVQAGQLLISEFRFRGSAGANDEFVELYNNTSNSLTVATSDGSNGWAVVAAPGTGTTGGALFVIPNGTVIPARGHFLGVNSNGFSLTTAAPGGTPYTANVADDAGVAVFASADPTTYNNAAPLDSVGFTPVADPRFREGLGLQPAAGITNNAEFSFVRKLTTGTPQDSGDNAEDFALVAPDPALVTSGTAQLGAPGPEDTSAPRQQNALIKASLIEPNALSTDSPNRVRDLTQVPNGQSGTLAIRRRFNNTTGHLVTRLRFRIVDVTTLNTPNPGGQQADVRLIDSPTFTITTSRGPLTVNGTFVETPPAQTQGGGLNSTAGIVDFPGGIASGSSIDVQFVLGVQANGRYRFFVNVEALP
ncbi:MAG TPA: Calx-beta domain-containing protein [Pyrinomonadaceae bacterium]